MLCIWEHGTGWGEVPGTPLHSSGVCIFNLRTSALRGTLELSTPLCGDHFEIKNEFFDEIGEGDTP